MTARPLGISFVVAMLAVPGCGDNDHTGPDAPGADAGPLDAAPPDGPPGTACGSNLGDTCLETQYCDFALNGCGAADETGICTDRPVGCPDTLADLVFEANCACDGLVYGSECDVYAAGSDLNRDGSCLVPPESFACGWLQCNRMTQYCRHSISDIGGEPDGYACLPVPACPTQFPTCACLVTEPCGDMCTGDVAIGLTLTCPGG